MVPSQNTISCRRIC